MNQRQLTAAEVCAARPPLVITHRGASRQAPENTLPAFAAALSLGVDLIELDYQAAADGTPVVIHDADLSRTTNAGEIWGNMRLKVAERTWPELEQLDAGSWFSPEFLRHAAAITCQRYFGHSSRIGPPDRAKIRGVRRPPCRWPAEAKPSPKGSSYNPSTGSFADCHRFLPQLALAALGEESLTDKRLGAAVALGALAVGWDDASTDADSIAAIHGRGLKAWVWTVDDPESQRQRSLYWGADGLNHQQPGRPAASARAKLTYGSKSASKRLLARDCLIRATRLDPPRAQIYKLLPWYMGGPADLRFMRCRLSPVQLKDDGDSLDAEQQGERFAG